MAVLSGAGFVAAVAGRGGPARAATATGEGLRFAFYGRMSTSEFQDPVTSRAWQRAVCDELVDGFGAVVGEYERAFSW